MGRQDRRGSLLKPKSNRPQELPWDLIDRCFLPIVFSHAAAVLLSFIFNTLHISQVSSLSLFLVFVICSMAGVMFYHYLQVSAAGKTILITSCDTRIGYALARQLDEMGFTVFACFFKQNEDSAKLKEDCSGRLHVLTLDVTCERQITTVREYIRANLPPKTPGLWALVNTAQWAAFGEVEWVPLPVYRQATEVNLLAIIRLTQVFLPMIRKTNGRIINVVSVLGRIPSAVRSPYCSVKSAVEAFSECLRLEMRRWGVDVVVIEPGDYTTGNCWFTNEKLLKEAKLMWMSMSDDVKSDYGQDYFEYKIKCLEAYTKGPESDLTPVTRSLVDAVSRSFPLARYTPVTRNEKIQTLVSDHLPRSVYEIIYG